MIFDHDAMTSRRDAEKAASRTVRRSATQETIGSSLWQLELRNDSADEDTQTLVERLAEVSGGGNLFFEPVLVNAAAGRISGAGLSHLTLFEQIGEERTAKLAIPFIPAKAGFPAIPVLQAFSHPFAPLSLPLAEQSDMEETADKFASLLLRLQLNETLVFEDFPTDEPLANLLVNALAAAGFSVRIVSPKMRAVLHPDPGNRDGEPSWLNAKRRRENSRLYRKLSELGKVEFEKAEKFWDVLVRFEEFLLLETRSWKGRGGTSIHTIKRDAAFARQSVCDMARQGKCEIYSMRLDNKAVASTILFKSSGNYFPWKTAFDSSYAAYSPGSQLMLRLSDDIIARPDFKRADSLAKFGNSWMTALWPDQTAYHRLIMAGTGVEAEDISRRLQLLDTSRQMLKKIFRRD